MLGVLPNCHRSGRQPPISRARVVTGGNQMWILKNSKELLENLKVQSLHSVNNIKSFDFSSVSRIVSDVFANDVPQVDFSNPVHTLLTIFPSFRPMGMVGEACLPSNAWWAKLAYQVMLTIHGRLITPFILGSMSVGLNILISHSFMDLWVWITA